jgi:hypothetical protein
MFEDYVEIPDRDVRPGATVKLARDGFAADLQIGDRMRFERAVEGRIESLEGMVVDLDEDQVEIDLPAEQHRPD